MKNGVIKLLKNTWGLLVFAVLSGCAYYAVILKFIMANTTEGGALLGFFFFPLIVFGAALILVKIIKQCLESEREGGAVALFWLHVLFIIMAAVYAAAIFV
ncbi:MAG: hypothetical protein J1F01_06445 [Oscillospiraceae bacterium]|nr:hypothetical protein [Oscillospiraceae bacterium]